MKCLFFFLYNLYRISDICNFFILTYVGTKGVSISFLILFNMKSLSAVFPHGIWNENEIRLLYTILRPGSYQGSSSQKRSMQNTGQSILQQLQARLQFTDKHTDQKNNVPVSIPSKSIKNEQLSLSLWYDTVLHNHIWFSPKYLSASIFQRRLLQLILN